jgi:uncharacterized membrane protein
LGDQRDHGAQQFAVLPDEPEAIAAALAQPWCVGAHWFTYGDEMLTGRGDGENFNIGFVSVTENFDFSTPAGRLMLTMIGGVVGLAGALVSVVSGAMAEEGVEHSGVPERILEIHETLGFGTFWVFAGLLGLRTAVWFGWIRERPALSLALGFAGFVVLLVASYFGGSLVYDYGAGVTLQR